MFTHILDRVIGVPLAIEANKLSLLNEKVFLNLVSGFPIDRTEKTPPPIIMSAPPGAYVFPIYGSLVNKNGAGASGLTSYESIYNNVINAVNEGKTLIGWDVSSSGGEAFGMIELGNFLASLPSKYGVQTFSYTNSIAASAAYALYAAAQHTFSVQSAMLGSIGTVLTLFSNADANKKEGIEYVILRSREEKALFNPNEKISEELISDARKKLEFVDKSFTDYVTSVRNKISLETINQLKGNTVFAEEAQQLGLVDNIVDSIQDVFAYFESTKSTAQQQSVAQPTKFMQQQAARRYPNMSLSLEDALEKIIKLEAELAETALTANAESIKATQIERQRCLSILNSAKIFRMEDSVTINSIKSGIAIDAATTMFESIRSGIDAALTAGIQTTGTTPSTYAVQQKLNSIPDKTVNLAQIAGLGLQQQTPVSLAGGMLELEDVLSEMKKFNTATAGV